MSQEIQQNPFPGLRSFESHEDALFFGREQQVHDAVSRLLETRFLAIVGSSGSGKSSLVRAGLIPALFKGKIQQSDARWRLALFRPGENPIGQLAEELNRCVRREFSGEPESMTVENITKILRENSSGLLNILRAFASAHLKNTLLVIDQFEEIFRFKQSKDIESAQADTTAFVELLLTAIESAEVPIYIVITMRSDFLSDCSEFGGLTQALNAGHYLVPRMTLAERRIAITAPITACGGAITERLVDRIILDTGNDPDQLPIMQHALMRTWDFWMQNRLEGAPIDIVHYEAIGTMSEALSRHCEEVFNEVPDPRVKYITEKLFKSLTNLGADKRGTRRPTLLSEICLLSDAKESEAIEIIERFRASGRSFLMPPLSVTLDSHAIVDISHESLMRMWERLRGWVEEETKSAELYTRIARSAELYQDGQGGLLVNPELQLSIKWREENKPNATWGMRYNPAFERAMQFLDYSQKQYQLAVEHKENRQKRELKRTRIFAMVLGGASIVSLLFLIVSLNLRFKAEASEREALKQQKIAFIESKNAEQQRKEAVAQTRISEQQQQIADEQKKIAENEKLFAISQQQIAVQQSKIAVQQSKIATEQKQEAISQKQQADVARDVAEVQRKEAVSQKQIADGLRVKAEESERNTQRLRLISVGRSLAIQASALSNEKSDLPALLAFQAYKFTKDNFGPIDDPSIYNALANVADDRPVFRGHQDGVRAVAVHSSSMISASDDGSVRLWSLNGGQSSVLKSGKLPKSAARTVAFSADGNYVAAGFFSGATALWNIRDEQSEPVVLNGHSLVVSAVAFAPNAPLLASAGADGKVLLWNYQEVGSAPRELTPGIGKITSIAFTTDGSALALVGDNSSAYIYTMKELSAKPITIQTRERSLKSVAFSADGRAFAVGGASGTVYVWDMNDPAKKPAELIGHTSPVTGLAFNSLGMLASCSLDRSIRLWSYRKPDQQPILLAGHDSWTWGLAFSPDGKKLASASADKTLRIWATRPADLADKICGKVSRTLTTEEWNKYVGEDISYESTCK